MNKFCVFIISHGRPNNVVTFETLSKCGYTRPVFIVCDNEDVSLEKYKTKFGSDKVLVFNKIHYASLVDNCDNFQNRRTTTHARNACFDFAKANGFDYFLVLDDDYRTFSLVVEGQKNTTDTPLKNLQSVCDSVCNFLESDSRICSVCFLQSGETIGGMESFYKWVKFFPFIKRKAMNSFFCKTDRRFWFFSRLNEDVNTYLKLGSVGQIFMTIPQVMIQQTRTQASSGGMSEAYLASGTYVKSFYTVMICPAFSKVIYHPAMRRLHHRIAWNNAVPKIIDERFKK